MYRNLYRRHQQRKSGPALLASYPLESVGRRSNDRFGWDVDFLSRVVYDWYDGDGLKPYVGGSLVANGIVSSNLSTHLQDANEKIITSSEFNNAEYLDLSAMVSNGTVEDFVIVALLENIIEGTDPYHCFSINGGNRFADPAINIYSSQFFWIVSVYGSSGNIFRNTGLVGRGFSCVILSVDANGLTKIYSNGNENNNDNTPTITRANLTKVNMGIKTAGRNSGVSRVAVFRGSGISDLITANNIKKINASVLGYGAEPSSLIPYFQRDSIASAIANERINILSSDGAISGSSDGMKISKEITNKCYRNINPQAATGWTGVGGVNVTRITDDSVALLNAKCSELGPSVIEINNPAGATGWAYNGSVAGNVNAHSQQIRAKHVVGSSGFKLGLYDTTPPAFHNGVEISSDYALTKNENITPHTTDYLGIEIPPMQKIYVIAQQMEESTFCTDLIPNYATGSTTARARSSFDTGHTIDNTKGSITFSIKFDGPIVVSDRRIFSSQVLLIPSGSNKLRLYDGTNSIDSTKNVLDGAWHDVFFSWGANGLKLSVDLEPAVTGVFDGNMGFSSTVILCNSSLTADYAIKNIKIYEDEK